MKRDGAEVAPVRLERVRRTPQWGCSRRYQALSQGGRALPCPLSRSTQAHATPCCLEALLLRQLDAARAAMLPCASLWAVACGPVFGRRL
eukprot:scaffold923_cov66-Phaeocystis_antarctica.AAC.1